MGKISTYPKDTNVTGLDILLGSDANTPGKITKNFSTNALASYFNKSAIIDTGQFSWEFLPYNNTQPQPEKTFMKVDWLDDTININNLAGVLRVSALTLGNTQPGAFIENEWVGNNILIHLPSAPSAYAIYTVDALVPDGDWYYLMTISYVGGQSFVIQKNEPVVMGYFAGANVITEITGTFPIIVSEGSIPDVSIDETVKGEWDLAYDNSIVSAAVTGTSTKTLTLTQQDGGTITASWTDEDTNLVTSVFGRTGVVVAVSGDYNTDLVTEATNLYFTQARAIASPITGYNPVAGTITASDTILTAINKLSGNISGGYVPYTGATTNVNLGEKGITAGYVGFDLTPTATPTGISTMYWDSAYRTVSLIDGDGDTTLQIGQEERILVHNNTGSTLTDGQVVYVTGSTGNLPSVSLADASSETTSAATLGVVTESIANGADGFITVSGMVNGLNTLAFTEGDLLWLSETAGQFTNIKPIAPAHLVLIGYVIKRAGGNGSILVKIQNTQELSESSDVLISAPEIDGQGLFLETISGVQLWRNRSIVDVLGYTPADEATTLTINGTTYDLSANRTWSVGTVTSIAVGLGTSGTDVNVSGSPITSSGTITLNIPSASAVNRGLLTPTDWTTFNNKQDAGNYITSLTGEATASGPGAAAVTLSTPAVTGKLLTGVNITGGTVVATDTILEAFGKVQNQINGLVGGSIYKGTWNAATNTPTITSGVGNTGWYYIVSVSGSTNIDGITDWNLGDWIIFDGTAWQQVDNTDAVVSVNGYTGAVSLVSSDVPEGLTNLYFTNARARGAVSLTTTGSSGAATYDSGTGVFNIPNYGSALTGYVPYSGATTNLDLGGNSLLAGTAIFSTGSTNPVVTLNNTTGDTSANFTINQGIGFSLNVYNTLSTKAIDFKVGGSSALVVTNGFNVLVGYTSDSGYKLDVNGSGRFIAGASADGVLVTNTGGRGFRVNNNTSGYGLIINNETASTAIPFVIQKNGANKITFTDAGAGTFTSSVTASALYVTGMTAGNGAIYHTGSRLTFANYNASGVLDFEVDGGASALTLNADLSATFKAGGSFSEALGIGTSSLTGFNLRVSKNITGAVGGFGVVSDAQIQSDVTSFAHLYRSNPSTQATTFTLTSLTHYYSTQGTIGAGSSITNQYGFYVENTLTGATNNYAYFSNLASGTNRWNLFMSGTASNYLAGSLGLGSTSFGAYALRNAKTITGATTAYGTGTEGTIQSDVTTALLFRAQGNTAAATFTTDIQYFAATQGTFGAGSTVTNQFGFVVASSLIGATNNYGFYGNIGSGTGRWNLYMAGTANNHLAGNLLIGSTADNGSKLQVTGGATFTNRIVVDTNLVTNNVMFLKNANSNGYGLSIQAGFGTNYALYVANNVGAKAFEVLANGATNIMGALSGTSATFSGISEVLKINGGGASTMYQTFNTTGGNYYIGISSSTGAGLLSGVSAYSMAFVTESARDMVFGTNNTARFTIASTGAATFSSSVTAGGTGGYYLTNGSTWNINTDATSFNISETNVASWLVIKKTSGNVGIGTTSPSERLHVFGNSLTTNSSGADVRIVAKSVGSSAPYIRTDLSLSSYGGFALDYNGTNYWYIGAINGDITGGLSFYSSGQDKLRLTSSGDLLVGKTALGWTVAGFQVEQAGKIVGVTSGQSAENLFLNRNGSNTGNFIAFFYNNGSVGSISTNGSTTSYNVTSDYRLKQDLKPINGLDIVNKIKVYDYQWKTDKTRMDGVLAHELQEVLPYAVTGVKDGEQMQSVDYSKIVPVLIQAIKDQQVQIEQLKNK